jgi:prevent-host-death family protein
MLNEVRAKSPPVITTKHGKPVVQLVPVAEGRDVVSPVIPLKECKRLK